MIKDKSFPTESKIQSELLKKYIKLVDSDFIKFKKLESKKSSLNCIFEYKPEHENKLDKMIKKIEN